MATLRIPSVICPQSFSVSCGGISMCTDRPSHSMVCGHASGLYSGTGPLCNCGNRGCLEAVASSSAILARVHQLLAANVYSTLRDSAEKALTLDGVCAAAVAGDKLANMVVAEAEESIGIGVASLINIFDPGTVILAGSVIESFRDVIIEGVQRIVRRRALHTITQRTAIVKSEFDANTAALGAATMTIERFLDNEILNL